MLLRASARQKEIAVRTALGAGRGVLMRQLLTESLLIAFCGGALGLAMAQGGLTLLRNFLPADTPRLVETAVDLRVLWFHDDTWCWSRECYSDLAPAWRASRTDIETVLRGTFAKIWHGARTAAPFSSPGDRRIRADGCAADRRGTRPEKFVAALASGNWSSVRSRCHGVAHSQRRDVRERRSMRGFLQRSAAANRSVPGVESVAIADSVPFGDVGATALAVEDHPEFSAASPYSAWYFTASPNLVTHSGNSSARWARFSGFRSRGRARCSAGQQKNGRAVVAGTKIHWANM